MGIILHTVSRFQFMALF